MNVRQSPALPTIILHLRDLPSCRALGAISDMRFERPRMQSVLLAGVLASQCFAQTPVIQKVRVQTSSLESAGSPMAMTTAAQTQTGKSQTTGKESQRHSRRPAGPATLTQDDGLSVIAAALDSRAHIGRQNDCSHLVHAIYDRAGFSYPYSSSSDLYEGTDEFRRVKHPQAGDLVVWSGHVGIVVNPAQHAFFSTLSHGPGIDTYDAKYWQDRGPVRFYRYIKRPRRAHAPNPE